MQKQQKLNRRRIARRACLNSIRFVCAQCDFQIQWFGHEKIFLINLVNLEDKKLKRKVILNVETSQTFSAYEP